MITPTTPHAYALRLAELGGDRTQPGLDVDLVTVFVPAVEAFEATDPGLPEAARWAAAAAILETGPS